MSQRENMVQPVEQIVRRKLSDEVFASLKRMITLGELGPGDEMPSERELMERFGVAATARASLALYNTRAEIDALVQGLAKVREVFS